LGNVAAVEWIMESLYVGESLADMYMEAQQGHELDLPRIMPAVLAAEGAGDVEVAESDIAAEHIPEVVAEGRADLASDSPEAVCYL
jgi:hypothetical protein